MVFIVVGDETGLLKLVDSDTGEIKCFGEQSRSRGVLSIVSHSTSLFQVLRQRGVVETWAWDCDQHSLALCGAVSMRGGSASSSSSSSSVSVSDSDSCSADVVCAAATSLGTFVVNRAGDAAIVKLFDNKEEEGEEEDEQVDYSMSLGGPISACATLSSSSDFVALGGKERDLSIYDLTKNVVSWEAKNVPYDKLSLRVPIWITAIQVIDENTIVTGTAHKHLRLYDIRSGARPVKSVDLEGDFRVAAMKATNFGNIVVADTAGNQHLMDYTNFKLLRSYKGATGSIRSIDTTSSGIISGGLDRHLRIYRNDCSNPTHTIYLKNRISAVHSLEYEESGTADENEDGSECLEDCLETIDGDEDDDE